MVRLHLDILDLARFDQRIAPTPALFNFRTTNEERLITVYRIQEQSFIGVRDSIASRRA
jgi:hypothetical protein